MLPRDLCDEAKRAASGKTGIPFDRILISATHCHSAPSSMSYCLGSRVDPRYRAFLPDKLVEAIVAANGGEMSLVGYDHARAANVAIVTYPDADAAATAAIQIDAAQLLDVDTAPPCRPAELLVHETLDAVRRA